MHTLRGGNSVIRGLFWGPTGGYRCILTTLCPPPLAEKGTAFPLKSALHSPRSKYRTESRLVAYPSTVCSLPRRQSSTGSRRALPAQMTSGARHSGYARAAELPPYRPVVPAKTQTRSPEFCTSERVGNCVVYETTGWSRSLTRRASRTEWARLG